jgi:hypothetical protein
VTFHADAVRLLGPDVAERIQAAARRDLAEHPLTEAQMDLVAHLMVQPPRPAPAADRDAA